MKILIILIVLVVLGFVLYRLNPMIAITTSGPVPSVKSDYTLTESSLVLTLLLENSDKPSTVTTLWVPESMYASAGFGEIDGFRHVPVTVDDGYTQEAANQRNREVRNLVGAHLLEPEVPTEIVVPIRSASNLEGNITGLFESKGTFGGSTSYFRINIGAVPDA